MNKNQLVIKAILKELNKNGYITLNKPIEEIEKHLIEVLK